MVHLRRSIVRLSRVLAAALALALVSPTVAGAKEKPKLTKAEKAKLPRLAILDFRAAPNAWSCGGWGNHEAQISDALRDLFTTEIMDKVSGKMRLVERQRLADVRGELNLQQSGEVDGATAQKVGKLLGAKYMLTGKITRFACKVSGASTGWGVGALVGKVTGDGLAGAVAGSVAMKRAKFSGRLDVRLIEVETGEILLAMKEDGESGDTSVKVAGGGTEVDYDDELVNKVFEPVVQKMAPKIVKKTVKIDEANREDEDEEE
jgi:curli biogenesis system outer membrane secretion channel CsgG